MSSQMRQGSNAGQSASSASSTGADSSKAPPGYVSCSKLLDAKPIDEEDPLETAMNASYEQMESLVEGKSVLEMQRILLETTAISAEKHFEVNLAILMGILTESGAKAEQFFQCLQVIVRDSFLFFLSKLRYIVYTKYAKLLGGVKVQLLWLLAKLIENNVLGVDAIVTGLVRHIRVGDLSNMNLWLCDNMHLLLGRYNTWLYQYPYLVATVFYAYARVFLDHAKVNELRELRNREAQFLLVLLKERFDDCTTIGREFVRLIQDLARHPEFEPVWHFMFTSPKTLSPNFKDMFQLLQSGTHRRFIQSRLTPTMETHLVFLMENVKIGNHKRYFKWFFDAHMNTPETEALLPDLVRFVCACFHPTNEILASDVITRWAILGWLLKSAKTPSILASVKLCLFYDWFFFQTSSENGEGSGDSFMNLEPVLLLMYHSLPRYPEITASLIEFSYLISREYFPSRVKEITASLKLGMSIMVSKGVVPSLDHIANSQHLSPRVKTYFNELFMTGSASSVIPQPPVAFPKDTMTPASDDNIEVKSAVSVPGIINSTEPVKNSPGTYDSDVEVFVDDNPLIMPSPTLLVDKAEESKVPIKQIEKGMNNISVVLKSILEFGLLKEGEEEPDELVDIGSEGFEEIRKVILGCEVKTSISGNSISNTIISKGNKVEPIEWLDSQDSRIFYTCMYQTALALDEESLVESQFASALAKRFIPCPEDFNRLLLCNNDLLSKCLFLFKTLIKQDERLIIPFLRSSINASFANGNIKDHAWKESAKFYLKEILSSDDDEERDEKKEVEMESGNSEMDATASGSNSTTSSLGSSPTNMTINPNETNSANIGKRASDLLHHFHLWITLHPKSFYDKLPYLLLLNNTGNEDEVDMVKRVFCQICKGNPRFIELLLLDAPLTEYSRLEYLLSSGYGSLFYNNEEMELLDQINAGLCKWSSQGNNEPFVLKRILKLWSLELTSTDPNNRPSSNYDKLYSIIHIYREFTNNDIASSSVTGMYRLELLNLVSNLLLHVNTMEEMKMELRAFNYDLSSYSSYLIFDLLLKTEKEGGHLLKTWISNFSNYEIFNLIFKYLKGKGAKKSDADSNDEIFLIRKNSNNSRESSDNTITGDWSSFLQSSSSSSNVVVTKDTKANDKEQAVINGKGKIEINCTLVIKALESLLRWESTLFAKSDLLIIRSKLKDFLSLYNNNSNSKDDDDLLAKMSHYPILEAVIEESRKETKHERSSEISKQDIALPISKSSSGRKGVRISSNNNSSSSDLGSSSSSDESDHEIEIKSKETIATIPSKVAASGDDSSDDSLSSALSSNSSSSSNNSILVAPPRKRLKQNNNGSSSPEIIKSQQPVNRTTGAGVAKKSAMNAKKKMVIREDDDDASSSSSDNEKEELMVVSSSSSSSDLSDDE